jgi:environmental stress-induced protein Ves
MIKIITPDQFKNIPWKNGQGMTTELAISDGGTVNDFDWRLSIASVVEDGLFSDFSGFLRHLILIEGKGIELNHNNSQLDRLNDLLDYAKFYGGCITTGRLVDGPIKDLNVMTRNHMFTTSIKTMINQQSTELAKCSLCFIYSLRHDAKVASEDGLINKVLPVGHLMQITNNTSPLLVIGTQVIIIEIREKL